MNEIRLTRRGQRLVSTLVVVAFLALLGIAGYIETAL